MSIIFFLISMESGQVSRGNIDIPTRLAPQETFIICRQTKILLKKGGNNYKGGETRPKPSKEKTKSKNKENNKENTKKLIMEISIWVNHIYP